MNALVTIPTRARARAIAEWADHEAHRWAGITLEQYTARVVDHLTHPTVAGTTYDVTRPLVDVDGCAWTCCGWAQDGDPLMATVDGWSAGDPLPFTTLCTCFGPLHQGD